VLGDLNQASVIVRRCGVHTVAVTACAEMSGPALRRLAWELEGSGVDLVVAPGLVDVAGPRLRIRPLCGLPLLHVEEPELVGARRLVKAALDRVGASVALVALAPIMLGLALAVRSTSPGPVLFRQARVGKDGREFSLWKFRTMFVDAEQRLYDLRRSNVHGDEVLFKMRNDPRVTPLGRRLRRFSLDELPQLVNVLRGHMSLVGPRPPLPREVARYGQGVHRRLLVKPGLTGLWQIHGRADLSWDESIRLDLRYVENWSLSLDIMILWKTLAAVVSGRGAY
jgi:exopolysaccharide biosynthesis polyprenyl glycosylphosphotransferase